MANEEMTLLEQFRDAMMDRLGAALLAPRFRGVLGASSRQLRGLVGQALPQASQGPQHNLGQVRENMKFTDLVRNPPKYLGNRLRIQGRTIGCDAPDHVPTSRNQFLQAAQKLGNVPVSRVVLQNLVEQPALLTGIDGRQDTEGTVIQFVGRQVAREVGQSPIQVIGLNLRLAFFFPLTRPSSRSWRMGQRRGDRARGARRPCDRASRLRTPVGRPS